MSPSRRKKHLAKAILSIYPFLLATACIARAAEDKTQSARRNVRSVCAHYKFIIQRASHTQTQSRSHTLEQKKPAQNLHCGASHHPYQLFISVLSSPATKSQSKWRLEAHGWRWSLFSEPRIIAFRQMPQFQLCECTGWEPAFARHCICFGFARRRLLIHCTGVLFKVAVKRLILCEEPLLPQPSAAEAAGPAVHLLCYCICLIMHVNTVEMHSPADQ